MFDNKKDFINTFKERIISTYGRDYKSCSQPELYLVLGAMVNNYMSIDRKISKDIISKENDKQLFYFSMEFLIGRLLTNNLMNLGIYDLVKDGLKDLDIDINDLEDKETDAALGNGGLGRLAACFLDSLATLNLPGHGNCIRYEYGLFKQIIENDQQKEVPDIWLKYGNPWETRKAEHGVDVKFYGRIESSWNCYGTLDVKHVDAQVVRAVPYDVPIVGYNTKTVNNLRLWKPEASENANAKDFISYIQDVNKICQNVYPDDSTEEGRMLRLKQEYFFVSAGVQTIVYNHYRKYKTLDNLPDKVVIQLNDTHPILIIPELMRILMDEYYYRWDDAYEIVSKTVAYTNHTILQEALEKWPVRMINELLPRIYVIIQELDRRFRNKLIQEGHNNLPERVAIIKDGQVHMSHLADSVVFSINGVAKVHTEILKNDVMKDFYRIYPEKFNNKTNGITQRRWLFNSNPQLTQLLKETIGDSFISNFDDIAKLNDYVDDDKVIKKFIEVKKQRKQILAKYIKDTLDIDVDVNSIFDVQAKRLHAYKRQSLNCLHIIYLYLKLKNDKDFKMQPRTFIFSAKAAPSYVFAKNVIQLINRLQRIINNDPEVNKYLKVVFIPNYGVSIAEILLNAADVSEQISTAGKEASGTGCMKAMMNGALTIGTLDGANIEMCDAVGKDNMFIFGNNVSQINQLRYNYNAYDIYNNNHDIKAVMDTLIDGTWDYNDSNAFRGIYDEIINRNDEYFIFADFEDYIQTQKRINDLYADKKAFAKMCLKNIAASGYFSSDRTIKEYNRDIWHLKEINK